MSLIRELKRRNVFRVAAGYVITGWLLVQVLELAADAFGAPDWVMKMIITVVVIGFVPTLLFAWAFELTPEGIKLERDVTRDDSITNVTARKLDYITLAAALGVVAMIGWQQLAPPKARVIPAQAGISAESTTGSDGDPGLRRDDGGVGGEALDTQSGADRNAAPKLGAHSIAVLPFVHRSAQADDLFFTDGIHDDLLIQLSKISDLRVISRTSVMAYRDTDKQIPQIARELGVAKILEGGVQRAGQRIRINAQLIDVATDEHMWAETFDRQMTIENLFDIQSEITTQIATAIKGQLTAEEARALDDKPTNSLAAWEAYSRARELMRDEGFNFDTHRAVLPLLRQAVGYDPQFYQAQARLTRMYGLASWIGYDRTEQSRQAAAEALLQATAEAPDALEVLTAQAMSRYFFHRDYRGALTLLQRALEASPLDSDILFNLGIVQRRVGRWDDSVASMLQAYAGDPRNVRVIGTALESLTLMGREKRVRELLPAALEHFPGESDLGAVAIELPMWADGDVAGARKAHSGVEPSVGIAYLWATRLLTWMEREPAAIIALWQQPEFLAYAETDPVWLGQRQLDVGWAVQLNGDADQANELLAEGAELLSDAHLEPNATTRAYQLATRARVLALQGKAERAASLAQQVIRSYPISGDYVEAPLIQQFACHALAIAGKRDEALIKIAELLETPFGYRRWYLYLDPRWDFFRDDPRFNELIRPDNLDESRYTENGVR